MSIRWLAASGLALVAAGGVAVLLSNASAADVVEAVPGAWSPLTGAEITSLAQLAGAHWPGPKSEIDHASFRRGTGADAGQVDARLESRCHALSDAEIGAALDAGTTVVSGCVPLEVTWRLSAGERTALGSVAQRFWATLATILEFNVRKKKGVYEALAIHAETTDRAACIDKAKTASGCRPVGVVQ